MFRKTTAVILFSLAAGCSSNSNYAPVQETYGQNIFVYDGVLEFHGEMLKISGKYLQYIDGNRQAPKVKHLSPNFVSLKEGEILFYNLFPGSHQEGTREIRSVTGYLCGTEKSDKDGNKNCTATLPGEIKIISLNRKELKN